MKAVSFTWSRYPKPSPELFILWESEGNETDSAAFDRRLSACLSVESLFVRYDNGQLCKFKRKEPK